MNRIAILALLLTSCGSHHHHAAPVVPPATSTAFADIAGTYLATLTFATGQPYDAPSVVIGASYTVTVTPAGVVTAIKHGQTVGTVYQLTRKADGSFQTIGRPLAGGLTEIGTTPADLATFHLRSLRLWAGFTDQGQLYGSEDFALIKQQFG